MIDPRLIQRKQLLFDASVQETGGRFAEAARTYQKLIELSEPDARLLHLRAVACRKAGLSSEAKQAISAAIQLAGTTPVLVGEQAEQAADSGDLKAALVYLDQALKDPAASIDMRVRLAELQLEAGDALRATHSARQAIAGGAGVSAQLILARACRACGNWAAMVETARQVLEVKPGHGYATGLAAEALLNLGESEKAADMMQQADETALALYADALKQNGNPARAAAAYAEVLQQSPDDAEVRFNQATALLASGDLKSGFEAYECRFDRHTETLNKSGLPRWEGGSLKGRHLLIRTEQGLGEEILHLRPLAGIASEAASVTLEITDRLIPLVRRAHPGITVVPRTNPPHPATTASHLDCFCPAGDLLRYRSDITETTWLAADPDVIREISDRSPNADSTPAVGLCWSTERTPAATSKSIPTPLLRPLLRLTGINFVSLQFGKSGLAEARALEQSTGRPLYQDDSVNALKDLDRAAAQIAALDLIICISTTTAHLAGALGRPAWVLLNKQPLWHWFAQGDRSPWYPGTRLYRQRDFGDWRLPLTQIRRDLEVWRDQRLDR